MMYKAVIFDLDGTLIDTLEDIAHTINGVLKEYSFPTHPAVEYKQFVGWGLQEATRRALPEQERTRARIEQCAQQVITRYRNKPVLSSAPYAGIRELMDALLKRAVPMAVLSNKDQIVARGVVEQLLDPDYFVQIRGSVEDKPKKPDPLQALEISALLNIEPKDILLVGDTPTDVKTALAGGMRPVGVTWGFRTALELEQAGAQVIISRPAELIDFF